MLTIIYCSFFLLKYQLVSKHKVGSRDEVLWSPYIIGPWVARVPADHACRTIKMADEMKRNGWDECGEMVEMKFVVGENWRNPEKNLPRPRFVHHETHMEWPRRELGNIYIKFRVYSFEYVVEQRWPELTRDLESATGSYTRALIGAAGVVNISKYQCGIFADTDCSFVFVDVILNLLTAVRHCLQSVYGCVVY